MGAGNDTYMFAPNYSGEAYITEDANADSDTLDFSGYTTHLSINLGSTGYQTILTNSTIWQDLQLSSATAIENILGGSGNDTLTGNSRDNCKRASNRI